MLPPYACGGVRLCCQQLLAGEGTRATLDSLGAAAVVDVEFESGIGGEDFGDFAEALGHGCGGEERVVAFAEIVVVDVEIHGKKIDGDGVGEAGSEEFVLKFFGVGTVGSGELAGLPGVERSFAADAGFDLLPGEVGEILGDSSFFD